MRMTLALIFCLLGTQAFAQEETITERIDACIGTVGAPGEHPEFCTGLHAQPCMEIPENQTTEGLVACISDEGMAWTEILEREYTRLLIILDEEQRLAMRSAQRKWAAYREAECAFPNVLVSHALAQPWVADCLMQSTARRAVEIRGYRDYLEY